MQTITFSIRASLTEAWRLVKLHAYVLVPAMAITMAANVVPGFILPKMYFISDLISLIVSAFFMAGFARMLLTVADGGVPKIEDVFSEGQSYFRMLAALFLTGIAAMVGFMRLVIPGIYSSMRMMFVYPLVIDQGLGAVEAIQKSWSMTATDTVHLLKLWFAIVGVIFLGLLAFVVGVLLAAPVAMLLLTLVYRQVVPKGKTAGESVVASATLPSSTDSPNVA